jgi:hypothetical protein
MEKEHILLQFRSLFNCDYGFQVLGNAYIVTLEGIYEGQLEYIATTIEEADICLTFSNLVIRDSGVEFLLNALKEFSGVRQGHSDLKGILSGTLIESSYPDLVESVSHKRMDYLIISSLDDYGVSNLIEATLTQAIWIKDTYGYIIFVNNDLEEALIEGLMATIQTELFEDCQWLVGRIISSKDSIYNQGEWLREGVKLITEYRMRQGIIALNKIEAYRVIQVCPQAIKDQLLVERINKEIFLDEELSATIEMLFEQELNLTDTAKALYIHRNTLLYRIDKIQKLTGFDLRKFSESFTFKILWLLNRT